MTEQGDSTPADILLVEDNPGDVRLVEEAFEDGRIENTLQVVGDGTDALNFLFQRDECADSPRFDIVLLDLDLPRMDGDEVLKEMRDDPELRRIPVIVLTNSRAEEDVIKSYDPSANAYLTKPVDPNEFIDVIRSSEEFWLSIVRLPRDDR